VDLGFAGRNKVSVVRAEVAEGQVNTGKIGRQ
jgi:hypothetical protein